MSKVVYISAVSLHIINRVRQERRELGIPQRRSSRMIAPNSVSNIVGTIESESSRASYTDPQLHIFAKEFSIIAREIQKEYDNLPGSNIKIKTEYSIYDFYPKQKVQDKLVKKNIEPFAKDIHPTGALYSILEDVDFLLSPRTTKEVTEEANRLFNKHWKTTDFGSPLDRAVGKGDLIKTDPPDVVMFIKAKTKNNIFHL